MVTSTFFLMIRRVFFFLFLALPLLASKPPEISPLDVKETLEKIFESHATYKSLSPVLIQRALQCYIEELDPTKTYFLKKDIDSWLNPSPSLLDSAYAQMEKNDFSVFEKILEKFTDAISRRNRLEEEIETLEKPKNILPKEFKNLSWAESEEILKDRLLKLSTLQLRAAEKLEPETKEKALKRIQKRRQSREEEFTTENPQEKARLVLSYVLKALASSLDSHTAYFTPQEASQFMIQIQQRLFGIGVQLRDDLSGFTIVKIIEEGPAAHTGLEENDLLIAVDGEPVVGMDIQDAVELIRGEEGTTVCLTVLRESETSPKKLDIHVKRGEVLIKEARNSFTLIPYGDGVIAQVALHSFYQDPVHSSAEDLQQEIEKIKRENKIKGIILDLRQNSGGVLPQAVAVTGLFITKGIVVSIKDNQGRVEHLRNVESRTSWDGPLIVLTSKVSASAAEIVAQTLQDYGRAIIVGDEHTYGKGTFQTFSLDACGNGKVNPKGEFKVTRGRYYTVSGKSPQLLGVHPDIVVPGVFSHLEIGEELAKYPLENDSINENFHDDLSDIPLHQRDKISWLYRFNLQPCLKIYTQHLQTLKKNSEERLKSDKLYQGFLKILTSEEEVPPSACEIYAQEDYQLKEAVNIMKDLIVLLK